MTVFRGRGRPRNFWEVDDSGAPTLEAPHTSSCFFFLADGALGHSLQRPLGDAGARAGRCGGS